MHNKIENVISKLKKELDDCYSMIVLIQIEYLLLEGYIDENVMVEISKKNEEELYNFVKEEMNDILDSEIFSDLDNSITEIFENNMNKRTKNI